MRRGRGWRYDDLGRAGYALPSAPKKHPYRVLFGAGGRARTDTGFIPRDFKSLASANSTTPAYDMILFVAPLQLVNQSKGLKKTGSPKKDEVFFWGEEPQRSLHAPFRLREGLRAELAATSVCQFHHTGVLFAMQFSAPFKTKGHLFSRVPLLWRRHPDLNRGVRVLQTLALPLGYGAKKNSAELCLERETRFEPATSTLARWRSTTELFPHNELSALYWWKL